MEYRDVTVRSEIGDRHRYILTSNVNRRETNSASTWSLNMKSTIIRITMYGREETFWISFVWTDTWSDLRVAQGCTQTHSVSFTINSEPTIRCIVYMHQCIRVMIYIWRKLGKKLSFRSQTPRWYSSWIQSLMKNLNSDDFLSSLDIWLKLMSLAKILIHLSLLRVGQLGWKGYIP